MNRSDVFRLPFVITGTAIIFADVFAAAVQLSGHIPLSPWESGIAMEALRLNAGLAIYEPAHATHLYGPLLNLLLAGVFRVCSFNLIAARIVVSIFAIAAAISLGRIITSRRSRGEMIFAAVLFLGLNLRTNLIAVSLQPDWPAIFFAVIALSLWINRSFVAALAFFIVAMLFKQTAAAFALIPFVHYALWGRPLRWRALAISLFPTMSILLALIIMRVIGPQMFYAVVAIPASMKVYLYRAPQIALYLFVTFPAFLVALWSLFREKRPIDATERWIVSALFVLVPTAIWITCKTGSGYNSLLFAYLAMTALVVRRAAALFEWLGSLSIQRRFFTAVACGVVILVSYFAQTPRALALLSLRHGDDKYDAAVALARSLDGVVVSPQDPTIAWRAKKYFGRALYCELDTNAVNGNWPNETPMSILQEIENASAVITVKSYVPSPPFERTLEQMNWRKRDVPILADSAYSLWTKQ